MTHFAAGDHSHADEGSFPEAHLADRTGAKRAEPLGEHGHPGEQNGEPQNLGQQTQVDLRPRHDEKYGREEDVNRAGLLDDLDVVLRLGQDHPDQKSAHDGSQTRSMRQVGVELTRFGGHLMIWG